MFDNFVSFILGAIASVIGGLFLKWLFERFYGKIRFSSILKTIDVLLVQLQRERYSPDYIVAVGRNGAVVASILSGHLGKRSILTVSVQTIWKESNIRETIIEASYMPSPSTFSQKNLLLVTCFVNAGQALKTTFDHYVEITRESPPLEIKTASIYTTVDPILKPDFFVYEVEKNFKMPMHKIMRALPWMRPGWISSIDK